MNCRLKTGMLAFALAGGMAAAQEDCTERIGKIEKIGDVQAALSCVDKRIAAENERARREEENNKNQMLQQIAKLQTVAKMRSEALKEATNGVWKEIPESDGAAACYISSIRLPPQGLCQVTYEAAAEHWSYNISDPALGGFMCIATCVWVELRSAPPANK